MKRKSRQASVVNPDIRSFFSTSPESSADTSNLKTSTPGPTRGRAVVSTATTVGRTPSPYTPTPTADRLTTTTKTGTKRRVSPRRAAGVTPLTPKAKGNGNSGSNIKNNKKNSAPPPSSSSSSSNKKRKNPSAPTTDSASEVKTKKVPNTPTPSSSPSTLSTSLPPASSSPVVLSVDCTQDSCGGVVVVGTKSGSGAPFGKENRAIYIPSGSGISSNSGTRDFGQQSAVEAGMAKTGGDAGQQVEVIEMSKYFLVRMGQKEKRYRLPLSEAVVGRDSMRDKKQTKMIKVRVGIPSTLESISREQIKLQVFPLSECILVTNQKNNQVRIQRWPGSRGLTTSSTGIVPGGVGAGATKKGAATLPVPTAKAIKGGTIVNIESRQQAYLYPGDSLEFDGWVLPGNSVYSYVLHPLPPGWERGRSNGTPAVGNAVQGRASPTGARQGHRSPASVGNAQGLEVSSTTRSPVASPGEGGRAAMGAARSLGRIPSSCPASAQSPIVTRVIPGVSPSGSAGGKSHSPLVAPTVVNADLFAPPAGLGAAGSSTVAGSASTPAKEGPETASKKLETSPPGVRSTAHSPPVPPAVVTATADPPSAYPSDCGSGGGAGADDDTEESGSPSKRPRLESADARRPDAESSEVVPMSPPKRVAVRLTPSAPASSEGGDTANSSDKKVKTAAAQNVVPSAVSETPEPAASVAGAATPQSMSHARGDKEGVSEKGTTEGAPQDAPAPDGNSWKEGDVVVLRARVGKGINKPGGVSRVLSVHDDGTYSVKLCVGSYRPQRVPADVLSPYVLDPEPAVSDAAASTSNIRRARGNATTPGRRAVRMPDPINGWLSPSPCSSSSEDRSPCVGRAAQPTISADSTPTEAADELPRLPLPGDRARVLYDKVDWYMGTVVKVDNRTSGRRRRGVGRGSVVVTVRYDGGVTEEVTLAAGDAEVCGDDELLPVVGQSHGTSSSERRTAVGGGPGNTSELSAAKKGGGRSSSAMDSLNYCAKGPGEIVLGKHDVNVLTEPRARALLDTVPKKLVGLTYQELHQGYGGWWQTKIIDVEYEGAGVDAGNGGETHGVDPRWPSWVVVEQKDPTGESKGKFRARRRVRALLAKLKTWDRQRLEMWKEAQEKQEEERGAKKSPTPKKPRTSARGAARLTQRQRAMAQASQVAPASTSALSAPTTKGSDHRQTDQPPTRPSQAQASSNPSPATTAAAVTSQASQVASGSTSALSALTTKRSDHVQTVQPPVPPSHTRAPSTPSPATATAAVMSAPAAVKKPSPPAQKNREKARTAMDYLPSCPICSTKFTPDMREEMVNAHLATCARGAEQEEEPAAAAAGVGTTGEGGGTNVDNGGTSVGIAVAGGRHCCRRREMKSVPMAKSLSSHLAIAIGGEDVVSVVAAMEGLSARELQPSAGMCDAAMHELLQSRCKFRTECVRRLLRGVMEAHPHCWQPFNWGRFEDSLQTLTTETTDVEAINAHAAAVSITLDYVEAHRRRAVTKVAAASKAKAQSPASLAASPASGGSGASSYIAGAGAGGTLPQVAGGVRLSSMVASLFLGAGGNSKDGREAVKKCARWAAKAWARQADGASPSSPLGHAKSRACMLLARALGESLENFNLTATVASGGDGSNNVVADSIETEGCNLVVVELEAHCGELIAGATAAATAARSRCGLLRALAGRPFSPRLAGMLLDSVTSTAGNKKLRAEVQALRDLLERQAAAAVSPVGVGAVGVGAGKGNGGRGVCSGGAKRRGAVGSGSAMLLGDLAV